jgi:hypothetical protein
MANANPRKNAMINHKGLIPFFTVGVGRIGAGAEASDAAGDGVGAGAGATGAAGAAGAATNVGAGAAAGAAAAGLGAGFFAGAFFGAAAGAAAVPGVVVATVVATVLVVVFPVAMMASFLYCNEHIHISVNGRPSRIAGDLRYKNRASAHFLYTKSTTITSVHLH